LAASPRQISAYKVLQEICSLLGYVVIVVTVVSVDQLLLLVLLLLISLESSAVLIPAGTLQSSGICCLFVCLFFCC
jgi:hypothetical protein